MRDHWHTLTRTGLAPELCRHTPEPFVDIHPVDAEAMGVADGALTRVQTAQGEAVVIARLSDRQRPGALFMPMHWGEAYAPTGRANPLVGSAVDARSGQPEFKHTPARARPYRETWRGFFIARRGWAAPKGMDLVWRRIPQAGCQLHEFAGRGDGREREALRLALARGAAGEPLRFEDVSAGVLREAHLAGERLDRVLFTTTRGALPPRDWLVDLFAAERPVGPQDRAALLIGRAPGRIIEAGADDLRLPRRARPEAIAVAIAKGADSVDAVGEATGAGTNCGSCRPEIARLLTTKTSAEVRHAA